MKHVPERIYLTPGFQSSSSKKRYDKTELKLIEEIDKWQNRTRVVLSDCFLDDNKHKNAFE